MDDGKLSSNQAVTKTLTARCFCKAVHFALVIPASSLPLKVHLCHCSICRYTHGTLCIFHAPLPSGVAPDFIAPSSLSNLTAYRHATALCKRYFCSTCGCHIGDVGIDDDEWVVSMSIFDANKDDVPSIWDIRTHVNTASAPGGGFYDWLPSISTKEMKVWNPEEPSENETAVALRSEVGTGGDEVLRAQCHCGGVSFSISRPKAAMIGNEAYKAWLSPIDTTKWTACLDVCGDCRLQTGAHAVGWALIPESCISPRVPADLSIGTSKAFASSDGVSRSFCGRCGATAMGYFDCGGTRRQGDGERLLNVATGILRAPEGVLAEDWLMWRTDRLAWAASGMSYDAAFTKALGEGFASWGRARHGEAHEIGFRTERETR
ncbi:Putative CENP-V/GFA domain, Mss4-like superfamily protein [Colletotrichum destructivum]|uniref:CENP-V/GFA domain, Mss4-like superfamily protein n=1 Tax=Colletotrichum destructivum TaxID=34406 RepID=A0AAX4ID12_9PEZI|nr:Putative CENP-V/GFA domain, Mss4-like superfamily protein [Colletotrichum destructivum]